MPIFRYENAIEPFLKNEADILFALRDETRQIPGIEVHDLFVSHIYLIALKDDPLAEKNPFSDSSDANLTTFSGILIASLISVSGKLPFR